MMYLQLNVVHWQYINDGPLPEVNHVLTPINATRRVLLLGHSHGEIQVSPPVLNVVLCMHRVQGILKLPLV